MVSTRSQTAQARTKDSTPHKDRAETKKKRQNRKNLPDSNTAGKRKTPADDSPHKSSTTKPAKRSKPAATEPKRKVVINRAPVLQLWAASVAHRKYPSLPWSTCISAGSAISTICAVSKGRSIGTISEPEESDEKRRKRDEAKKAQKELNVIDVMRFKLKLKDGLALVGSEQKGKSGDDGPLRKKFGEEQYHSVKKEFEESLSSWKDHEEELNEKAFGFYETFRPSVSAGQKGWGRKGELNLDIVRDTVERHD